MVATSSTAISLKAETSSPALIYVDIILESGVQNILVHKEEPNQSDYSIIYNTLQKDQSNSEKEAVLYLSLIHIFQKKVAKLEKFYDDIKKVEVSLKVVKPETAENKEAGVKVLVPNGE